MGGLNDSFLNATDLNATIMTNFDNELDEIENQF